MGMTVSRWSLGVALGCAAFAAIILPFPATPSSSWASSAPPPLATEIAKLAQAAGEAHAAVRGYRAAQALDRSHVAADVVRRSIAGLLHQRVQTRPSFGSIAACLPPSPRR